MITLVTAALLLTGAHAPAFEIEADSLVRTYEVRAVSEEALLFAPFSQSLRFSITQPIRRGQIGFNTYFRGFGDAAFEGAGFSPKLYLAHVDLRRGKRHSMNVRLGRQISMTHLEFFTFDGARIRYRGPAYFAAEVYGGSLVNNTSTFENPADISDVIVGGSLILQGIKKTQARIGFRHVQGDDGLKREDIGLDVAHKITPRVRAYANGNFSTALLTLDELLLGSTVLITDSGISTDVEAFRFRPTFAADSIFNIFQTAPYHEARVRLRVPLRPARTRLYTRVGAQFFASEPGLDGTSIVASLGGRTRVGREIFVGYNALFGTGYGGDRVGGNIEGGATLFDDRLHVTGGAHFVNATNDLLLNNRGAFIAVYAAARAKLGTRVDIALHAEETLSDVGGNRLRATANLFVRWNSFDDGPDARKKRRPKKRRRPPRRRPR